DDQRMRTLDQQLKGRGPIGRQRDLAPGSGENLRKLLTIKLAVFYNEDASIHGALIQLRRGQILLSSPGPSHHDAKEHDAHSGSNDSTITLPIRPTLSSRKLGRP